MLDPLVNAAKWLALAYELAAKSPDPSNQNGAVIVASNRLLSVGINDFPIGFTRNVTDRDAKLKNIEHAERASIYALLRGRIDLTGASLVMYCPWAPCHECARAIVESGIDSLVVHRQRMVKTPDRWATDVREAIQKLKRSVKFYEYDGPVPSKVPVIVNGESWFPYA